MIDGFRVYKFYLATKLHFTTDKFNVFENKGRVRGSREKFWSRNDRGLFEKLGREFETDRDIIEYFVSNFMVGNDCVVYSGDTANDNYKSYLKIKQSLGKQFENDLSKILLHLEQNPDKVNNLYDFDGTTVPELMKLLIGGDITTQSLIILDSFRPFLDNWNVQTNLIFEEECRKVVKSKGFLKFESDSMERFFYSFEEDLGELNNGCDDNDILSLYDKTNTH